MRKNIYNLLILLTPIVFLYAYLQRGGFYIGGEIFYIPLILMIKYRRVIYFD